MNNLSFGMRKNEIGSDFSLEKEYWNAHFDDCYFSLESFPENSVFLSTCRSAIALILDGLPKGRIKRALVPGFTCHSVLDPFLKKGYQVYPYPVNNDLSVQWQLFDDLVEQIAPSVILLHSYFGFNTLSGGSNRLADYRKNGIIVIEDQTQRLFSSFVSVEADYYVGSIRKWMPISDGAFLSPYRQVVFPEDVELVQSKISAFINKERYLLGEQVFKDEFLEQFRQAEVLLDCRETPFAMSSISKGLFSMFDIERISFIRRNNYEVLARRFVACSELQVLFPELPEDVVPFLFPVLVPHGRKELQSYMASHDVYPTVIWACPDSFTEIIQPSVRVVFEEILCFHCDQRYSVSDMNRIGDLLDSFFQNRS